MKRRAPSPWVQSTFADLLVDPAPEAAPVDPAAPPVDDQAVAALRARHPELTADLAAYILTHHAVDDPRADWNAILVQSFAATGWVLCPDRATGQSIWRPRRPRYKGMYTDDL